MPADPNYNDYNGFHEDFGDCPSVEERYNPDDEVNWDEVNQWDEDEAEDESEVIEFPLGVIYRGNNP